MKNNNLICVGIPFYNAAKYLDWAIRSVMNQTYPNWKLILLDDGSTDSSLDIALKYENDERIKIISDGENRGLAYRLNQIVELSDSKYIARMDADDIMHPRRLELQLQFLEKHPYIDLVGSWAYSIDTNNHIHGLLKNHETPSVVKDAFNHACFIHPSVLGTKQWFEENPYNSTFARIEDMELWCRTISYSRFYNLTEPLMYYREVGIPYLNKYLQSMKGERQLIVRTYQKTINCCKMLLINYLKCFTYSLFSFFHLQKILIKTRSVNTEGLDLKQAYIELNLAIDINIE